MRALIIEDDLEVADFVSQALSESGFITDSVHDGREGLYMAANENYDIIILDRMLPGKDGLSVLRTLRATGITTPVLLLSALGEVRHRIDGLHSGGDDYMVKPFSVAELIARVHVLLKRTLPSGGETELTVGDLKIDLLSRRATRAGRIIDLKPKEYKLLEFMMRHAGQVVTRTILLEQVWDYNFAPQTNVIDVHISRLRNKIDKGFTIELLHTIRGAGYCIRED
ncbi:response regulator transcription factor [Kiloniella laminariae]|uniref:Response regulator transcription factor n=1 Tax=Kiloniella laminariae TaxID=454162 RepID=A0ABT4LNS1_9PROT|nr:response regulator transcription factor [Kiloniella laminariae]MCZ4281971.1 response regulator transcription factor [Kiloniella laminariae]